MNIGQKIDNKIKDYTFTPLESFQLQITQLLSSSSIQSMRNKSTNVKVKCDDLKKIIKEHFPEFSGQVLDLILPYPMLTTVQSHCLPQIVCRDSNTLVNAPTSSGKTLIYFLAILRVYLKYSAQQRRADVSKKAYRSLRPLIFFLAPIKSLINQLSR
jgi:replicative superfamily II helicase